jgi:hypothetical protein
LIPILLQIPLILPIPKRIMSAESAAQVNAIRNCINSMPQIGDEERNICSYICFDFEGEAVDFRFESGAGEHML